MFGSDSDVDEEFLETALSGVSNTPTNDSAKTTRLEPSRPGSGCSRNSNNLNIFTAEHRPVNAIHGRAKNLTSCHTDGENLLYHTPVKRQQLPGSISSNSNNSIERKFPGPAGILPERRNALSCPTIGSPLTIEDTIDCSTSSSTHFNLQSWHALLGKKTWQKLLTDLKSQFPDKNLLDIVNIKSIKAKASARLLVGQKVPYLGAIVQEVSLSSPDPYITLCDQTGCIGGAVHRDVWKQFGEEITTGCVFLLRNVGVLSLGINPLKNQHYLNITENNLAALYSEQEDSVRITNIYPLQTNEIEKSIDDWKSDVVPISSPGQSPNQTLLLFSSPLRAGNNTVHGTLSSRSESSFHFSPQPSQRPQLFNTPARNKAINEKLSNVKQFSKCGKRNYDQQSQIISSSISTNNTVNVCHSKNIVPNNQSSCVRNSSTILDLMSANKNNSCKRNSNVSQDIFSACSGNNNPVNTSLTNSFNCNSKNVSTHNNFVSSNNNSNTRMCKTGNSSSLNKFFSPKSPRMTNKSNTSQDLFLSDTSSDNISENSFSSICNLPKDNSVKEHSIIQKNEKILACRNNSNSCYFQPKKGRFDSQESNIVSDPNLDFERIDKYPSNNNSEWFRPNSSFVDRNRINLPRQVTNKDEQWEVDTILSGLDANSFLDDDF